LVSTQSQFSQDDINAAHRAITFQYTLASIEMKQYVVGGGGNRLPKFT